MSACKINIDNLIWDDFNTSHIAKHKIKVHEIEMLLKDKRLKFLSARNGRFFASGKSGKRLLAVVIAKEKGSKFYVVTARDMSKSERGTTEMTKINKIPKFNSIKEEANFWDKHNITDYLPELEPSKLSYKTKGGRKEAVTIRVSPALKNELSKVADEYDISPSSLIRMWVVDKLHEVSKGEYGH